MLTTDIMYRLDEHAEDIGRFTRSYDGLDVGGETWPCWTDGARLVAARNPNTHPAHIISLSTIARYESPPALYTFDTNGLRTVERLPRTACGAHRLRCGSCNGTGKHSCSCAPCQIVECLECNGSGYSESEGDKCELVRFGGRSVDKRLLGGGILDTAPDGPLSVTVGSPAEAVMIRSDDWILVVMPVLVGDETAPAPDAPLVPATDGRAA